MVGYTKLFSEILDSTVWEEAHPTRIVWITMLAMRDQYHKVSASVPGLARRAIVTLEECEAALDTLSSPDPHSRTTDFEGRRIEKIDGGWLILNAEKYRKRMNEDERREAKRLWIREKRAKEKGASVDANVDNCRQQSTVSTQTETETEEETDKKKKGAKAPHIRLWDIPRAWCGPALLGRILKEVSDDKKVKQAILDTLRKEPAEPKTYFLALLKDKSEGSATPVWQMSEKELLEHAEKKGIPTRGKTTQQLINELR